MQTTDVFSSSGSDCYTSFGKVVSLFVLSLLSTIVIVNTSVQTYWTEEKLSVSKALRNSHQNSDEVAEPGASRLSHLVAKF